MSIRRTTVFQILQIVNSRDLTSIDRPTWISDWPSSKWAPRFNSHQVSMCMEFACFAHSCLSTLGSVLLPHYSKFTARSMDFQEYLSL